MVLFAQRQDPVKLMRRRLVVVGLLVVLVVLGRGVWGVYKKEHESRLLREAAEAELQAMQRREADVREDIARLGSDRGVEEVLRQEYDLAGSGEGVIVIVEPPPSSEGTQTEPAKPSVVERVRLWWRE